MVDRESRAIAARLVRQFIRGDIDSDRLEDDWPTKSDDRALEAIGSMLWLFYDDLRPRRMIGREAALPEEAILLKRYACFLDSDLTYDWPEHNFIRIAGLGPLVFLSLGLLWPIHHWIRVRNRRFDERMAAHGDIEVWPFSRPQDWDGERREPYMQ